ncbi:oligosaccharide flippase family protein, partial [Streptomyces scabiei]|uniref:oligosaccharide flippase family protein n=1 Tax=Streptomyces scabiei TaxID=1930 RepID=UPI0038F68919
SLASAARGLGAMSMVWGNIARSSLWLVAVTLAAGRRDWLSPVRLELARVRKILRFSWPLAVASACNFASRAWDQAIVSSCQ